MKQVIEEKLFVENFPNFSKFSGKIPWKFSEIFRKNMKFSGQFFRLTSLTAREDNSNCEVNCVVLSTYTDAQLMLRVYLSA
jgi:hypothetical protein